MKFIVILSLILLIDATSALADETKAPLTNADVISLVKAGLPESTVLMTIRSSPAAFDTSPKALIGLKKAGIPSPIIEAILQASSKSGGVESTRSAMPTGSQTASPQALGGLANFWGTKQSKIDVDRVFLLDGDNRTEMKYSRPGTRSRWAVVMQTFAVLNGPTAQLRTSRRRPEFEMILPDNVEPSSVVVLGLLATRSNSSREVLVSSAYLSASQGLPAERNIRLVYDKAADQSGAPEGYEIYRMKPADALQSGEYAFIVSRQGPGAMGAFGGNAGLSYNFYELGVD